MSEPFTTRTIQLHPDLPISIAESGRGRVALVLHGGGGPPTVQNIADHLQQTMHVIVPTHPGWNGNERPAWLTRVSDLARVYLQLLQHEGYREVLVIGSSIGGWIAADMAASDEAGRIRGLVLIDAAGVDIPGQPIVDFFALDPRGVAEHSFHDPDRFYIDPSNFPPEQVARQRANMATMRILASDPYMVDPTLLGRLGQVQIPVLLLWGDSDRIFTAAYGQAFAAAFPRAIFTVVADAGHLPHIEQPDTTFAALDAYINQA